MYKYYLVMERGEFVWWGSTHNLRSMGRFAPSELAAASWQLRRTWRISAGVLPVEVDHCSIPAIFWELWVHMG